MENALELVDENLMINSKKIKREIFSPKYDDKQSVEIIDLENDDDDLSNDDWKKISQTIDTLSTTTQISAFEKNSRVNEDDGGLDDGKNDDSDQEKPNEKTEQNVSQSEQ